MSLEQNTAIARVVYEAQRAIDDATEVNGAMPRWDELSPDVREQKRVQILRMRENWNFAKTQDKLIFHVLDVMISAFNRPGE